MMIIKIINNKNKEKYSKNLVPIKRINSDIQNKISYLT